MQVFVHVAAARLQLMSEETCSLWEYRGLETPPGFKTAWLLFCVRAGPSYKSSLGSLIKIDE